MPLRISLEDPIWYDIFLILSKLFPQKNFENMWQVKKYELTLVFDIGVFEENG